MKKYFPIIFCGLLFLSACGGRIPPSQTAQGIIKGHLNQYGKKYPDSILGSRKVEKVEIIAMDEIQRHVAFAKARVGLDNGTEVNIQMNFIYKAPFGWRYQGWEILDSTANASH